MNSIILEKMCFSSNFSLNNNCTFWKRQESLLFRTGSFDSKPQDKSADRAGACPGGRARLIGIRLYCYYRQLQHLFLFNTKTDDFYLSHLLHSDDLGSNSFCYESEITSIYSYYYIISRKYPRTSNVISRLSKYLSEPKYMRLSKYLARNL